MMNGGLKSVSSEPARILRGADVSLNSLVKWYGKSPTPAVRDVSLEIKSGDFVTLLGPSGSGKTTTLMMIAGFETVTSGEIVVGGKPITDLAAHKRDIGVVFQNYALFPHLTVRQNIEFPLKMRRWNAEEIACAVTASLKLVRLEEFGDRYPSQLSGGQQQRVALARATVFTPKLLLMDEPLSALDRQLRQAMQIEIKRIQRSLGITVVAVTHDQEEALTMSDLIVVMNDGKIVQKGTASDIYERPETDFVANFVGENNLLSGVVVDQANDGSVVRINDRIRLTTTTKLMTQSKATLSIRPEHISVCNDQSESSSENRFPANVLEWIYSGATTRGILELGNTQLIVRVPGTEQMRVGKVEISIDPARVIAVRNES